MAICSLLRQKKKTPSFFSPVAVASNFFLAKITGFKCSIAWCYIETQRHSRVIFSADINQQGAIYTLWVSGRGLAICSPALPARGSPHEEGMALTRRSCKERLGLRTCATARSMRVGICSRAVPVGGDLALLSAEGTAHFLRHWHAEGCPGPDGKGFCLGTIPSRRSLQGKGNVGRQWEP